jgi:hypothetical protein
VAPGRPESQPAAAALVINTGSRGRSITPLVTRWILVSSVGVWLHYYVFVVIARLHMCCVQCLPRPSSRGVLLDERRNVDSCSTSSQYLQSSPACEKDTTKIPKQDCCAFSRLKVCCDVLNSRLNGRLTHNKDRDPWWWDTSTTTTTASSRLHHAK